MGHTHHVIPITTQEYRRPAEGRLPRFLFGHIDGGANDALTLAAHVEGFQRIRPRAEVRATASQPFRF